MPNISEKIKKLEDLRIELLEEERELEELKKLLKEKESKKGDLSEIENIRMILINEKTKKESLETENIAIKIELGKVEREIESLTNTLKEFTKENHQNESFDKKILEMSINQIKRKREEALRLMNELGYVNLLAIEEFERFNKEYQELKSKIEKIKEEILEINKLIEEIEETKREKFFKVLYELSSKFDQTFKKIFGGGEAKLELENFDDLNSGLIIKAHPSNKKPHTIDSLSGGEKTLTAVAFIFAIQEMKKSPFYLLDEIDAALDKNNSYKIAQLLKEYSKSTQIIVVSHNEEVVKNADRIYGVSIRNGISRLRSIVLEDEAKLEAELKAN
jgi:chromosome segregation protein